MCCSAHVSSSRTIIRMSAVEAAEDGPGVSLGGLTADAAGSVPVSAFFLDMAKQ